MVLAFSPQLVDEIESVEHDRLGQRNRENSMHEDLRKRAGIAPDRAGHA